jgi:hypothetical protein
MELEMQQQQIVVASPVFGKNVFWHCLTGPKRKLDPNLKFFRVCVSASLLAKTHFFQRLVHLQSTTK